MPQGIDNATARQRANDKIATGKTSSGATVSVAFTNCTTATAATTGGAPALPTYPVGYVEVLIGTTVYKIPFYNV